MISNESFLVTETRDWPVLVDIHVAHSCGSSMRLRELDHLDPGVWVQHVILFSSGIIVCISNNTVIIEVNYAFCILVMCP